MQETKTELIYIDKIIDGKLYSFKNANKVFDFRVPNPHLNRGMYDCEMWLTTSGNWFSAMERHGELKIYQTYCIPEVKDIMCQDIDVYYQVYDKYFPDDPIEKA